jgi:hypothetical protein
MPNLQNEKTFPNVMCPINLKGIKQVMKYIDHSYHDFLTLAWETTGKKDRDE